jgi:hypothetical protein
MKIITTTIAAIIVVVVLSIALHGGFTHTIVAVLAALVSICLAILAFSRRKFAAWSAYALALTICVAASRLFGGWYYVYSISVTEKELSALIAYAESQKAASGTYPATVDLASFEKSIPVIFRGRLMYWGREDMFHLSFRDVNSGLDDRYVYESGTKHWELRLR